MGSTINKVVGRQIKEKNNSNRNISFDILRIIAILMVFYNHRYTFIYSDTFDNISLKYILGAILSIFCKCGPPIFFMVSGALLLKKEEKFSYILKHRVLRIIIVMIVCTILVMLRDKQMDFFEIFLSKLNWYLYQYLAYLLMLPIFRKISLNSTEKDMKLYLILVFIFYTLNGLFIFFDYEAIVIDKLIFYNSNWGSACWYFIFPLSGYFLVKILLNKEKNKKYLLRFGIASLVTLILYLILCSLDIKMYNCYHLENLREHAIYPISLFLFTIIFVIEGKINSIKIQKILSIFSAATFGMFIIETHTNFSNLIFEGLNELLHSYMGLYWISIVSIIVQFLLYALLISLIRLVPFVKKII